MDMHELAGVCNSLTEMRTCCHTDWVHPTAEGYASMADVWFNALEPLVSAAHTNANMTVPASGRPP